MNYFNELNFVLKIFVTFSFPNFLFKISRIKDKEVLNFQQLKHFPSFLFSFH